MTKLRTRPVVALCHGFLGFDRMGAGPAIIKYWPGLSTALDSVGVDVVECKVPPVSSIARRAQALHSQVGSALEGPRWTKRYSALSHPRCATGYHSSGRPTASPHRPQHGRVRAPWDEARRTGSTHPPHFLVPTASLDARHMISHLLPPGRVRTLTTVGTPHRGSALACLFGRPLERFGLFEAAARWQVDGATTGPQRGTTVFLRATSPLH